jgi:CelD/BcsL family acetyltransferase involved in cellulose biosynthesis
MTAAIRSEAVPGLASSDEVVEAWERMSATGEFEPSASLEWSQILMRTHVAADDRVFTIVVRDAGRIVAIAPVVVQRERLLGLLPVATLSPLCEKYRTHSDVLGECHRPEVVAALFEAMRALPVRWDLYRVGRMLESGRLARGLKAWLADAAPARRLRREYPSFLIALDGDFDAFLRSRSGKFRNYLRRKTRQLDGMGTVELRRAGAGLGIEQAYRDLLAVEERSWKHAHGTAITSVPRQRQFYWRLCEESWRRGRLHLTLLYLDGRPIAFNLGLVSGDRYYYLKTSFDETCRQAGAATVCRAKLIELLVAEGLRWFDFPGEPYQWEEQWTDRLRWNESALVFNAGTRSTLLRAVIRLRDLLRRGAAGDEVRFVDPRSQRAD